MQFSIEAEPDDILLYHISDCFFPTLVVASLLDICVVLVLRIKDYLQYIF